MGLPKGLLEPLISKVQVDPLGQAQATHAVSQHQKPEKKKKKKKNQES